MSMGIASVGIVLRRSALKYAGAMGTGEVSTSTISSLIWLPNVVNTSEGGELVVLLSLPGGVVSLPETM